MNKPEEPEKLIFQSSYVEGEGMQKLIAQSCNINITLDMHLTSINSAAEVCKHFSDTLPCIDAQNYDRQART